MAAILLSAGLAGCSIEGGPGCPSNVMAVPNGRENTLFFVGGGYTQNGLWRILTIPETLQPDNFTVTTGTVVFHEPTCVIGSSGFPLLDENGDVQCDWDVDASTTSDSCTLPLVNQGLNGLTLETIPVGNNVMLAVQQSSDGIAFQVACDMSLTGGEEDRNSGLRVVLREPDGAVRYDDTIYILCKNAFDFNLRYDGLLGENYSDPADGTVHVGDEFHVYYSLLAPDRGSQQTPRSVFGYGMASADASPPFEIVAYEPPMSAPARLLLRALAPADHPHIIAGAIEGVLPVTILP